MKSFLILLLFCVNLISYEDIKLVPINIISVYDGDTFRINIPEYPDIIGKNIPIRVGGIDTPEIRGKCTKEKILAMQAKQVLIEMLYGAKEITLKNVSRPKYFRILADVYADNINVADVLMGKNIAVAYYGKTKIKDWCK